MKQPVTVLLALLVLLLLVAPAAAQDLPVRVRETAIADLNARIPGIGQPTSWRFHVIVSNNQNLDCASVPPGLALTPVARVYVVELVYPSGSYVYHITEDAAHVIPCDPKIPTQTNALTPGATIAPPRNPANYNFVTSTCPPDFAGFTAPQLTIGGFGLTRGAGDPALMRDNFGVENPVVDTIPPLTAFYVLAGPECTFDGSVWWRIEWEGRVGWIEESRLGGYYFVAPLENVDVYIPPTPSLTPTATLTPSPTPTVTPTFTPTFTATPEPRIPPGRQVITGKNATHLVPFADLLVDANDAAWFTANGETVLMVVSSGGAGYFEGAYLMRRDGDFHPDYGLNAVRVDSVTGFAAVSSADGLLQTVELADGDTNDLPDISGEVQALAVHSSGLLASGDESSLRLWRLDPAAWQTPNGLIMVVPYNSGVSFTDFISDGSRLAAFDNHLIEVFDTATGETVLRYELPDAVPSGCGGLAFIPNSSLLVFGDCENVYFIDINTQSVLSFLTVEDASITQIAAHPGGELLAIITNPASGAPAMVSLYDITSGAAVFTLTNDTHRVVFDPEGTLLTLLTTNGIEFWGVR